MFFEFPITITQEEVETFCRCTEDTNPHHQSSFGRVAIPGMLLSAKAFGKTDSNYFAVWLVEQQVRFKKPVFVDEPIIVRHTLLKEKQTSKGLFQEVHVQVKVNEEERYVGKIKIMKVKL